jgi:hypothetical protein
MQYSVTHHMHQMIDRISDNTHVQRHVRSRRVMYYLVVQALFHMHGGGTLMVLLLRTKNLGCMRRQI